MPHDPAWTCPRCGAHQWVAAAFSVQCVPCGFYDASTSADEREQALATPDPEPGDPT